MTEQSESGWDRECDVLIVGSGAGALVGALLAANAGLRTVVVEKTDEFGGTTAYSGGGLWIPLSAPTERASVVDSPDLVESYLDATVGMERRELRDAYLAAGPRVIDELEANQWIDFEWRAFPDYYCEALGAQTVGRSIYALNFDVTGHEKVVEHLRQPLPPEKGGWKEPFPVMIGGRAFLGRLLVALSETDAVLLRGTALESLIVENGRVTGAVAESGGAKLRIGVRRGVLLAAGGFERDAALRSRYQAPLTNQWTLGAPGNTGAALRAAVDVGADTELLEECWWAPGLMLPDGTPSFRLFERGKPGGIMVNGAGERFANETWPYDRLGRAMVEGHAKGVSHMPCWFVVDQAHVDKYGFATARAGKPIQPEWFDSGVIVTASTVGELAGRIGVPAGPLEETVKEFNGYARLGRDEKFHRGELAFDRFFGDDQHAPNPNLGPLETPPYYAWKVMPADLGTKGGIRCDGQGRALGADGKVIGGLYAAGNTMASWTNHCYPGPGSPIGSCIVFSALAVHHMIDS
jgi:3-oxosteroid 1-dehydrogenase